MRAKIKKLVIEGISRKAIYWKHNNIWTVKFCNSVGYEERPKERFNHYMEAQKVAVNFMMYLEG